MVASVVGSLSVANLLQTIEAAILVKCIEKVSTKCQQHSDLVKHYEVQKDVSR